MDELCGFILLAEVEFVVAPLPFDVLEVPLGEELTTVCAEDEMGFDALILPESLVLLVISSTFADEDSWCSFAFVGFGVEARTEAASAPSPRCRLVGIDPDSGERLCSIRTAVLNNSSSCALAEVL